MPTIQFSDYNKTIRHQPVLQGVNYTFETGKIYGLLGRNGSGKTMILRAIAGLIHATSGQVSVDGQVIHRDLDFPPDTGVIIEHTDMLPQYSAFRNLEILSRIRRVADATAIHQALAEVGLADFEDKKVRTYSLGMRQKLSLAQAIFERPSLLLLDEPTNGLDSVAIQEIRQILLRRNREGCTIIVASHNSEDLDVLADEIVKVEAGSIIN